MPADRRDDETPAEPHGIWSGTITFGLVSVPVELYSTVRAQRTRLRTFGPEGQPLVRRYFCSADGRALDRDEIVRGYEWDDGSFTVVTDDELEALEPRRSREIDLERFVDRDRIPLEMLERSYVLAPRGESTKAYHLLAATMERNGRAGIATFVMRGKEYLAAIFASGGLLQAATLRFAAELRTPETIGLPAVPKVPAADRRAFEKLLGELEDKELDVTLMTDESASRLEAIAARKRDRSKDVVEIADAQAEDPEESAEIIDIMSILRERMGTAGKEGNAAQARQSKDGRGGATARREAGDRKDGTRERNGPLERESKKELYERARRRDLPGRSQMTKDELVDALREDSGR